jgi:hypothetical protein
MRKRKCEVLPFDVCQLQRHRLTICEITDVKVSRYQGTENLLLSRNSEEDEELEEEVVELG